MGWGWGWGWGWGKDRGSGRGRGRGRGRGKGRGRGRNGVGVGVWGSTAGMGAPLANSVSVKRSELTTAARVKAEACDSRA